VNVMAKLVDFNEKLADSSDKAKINQMGSAKNDIFLVEKERTAFGTFTSPGTPTPSMRTLESQVKVEFLSSSESHNSQNSRIASSNFPEAIGDSDLKSSRMNVTKKVPRSHEHYEGISISTSHDVVDSSIEASFDEVLMGRQGGTEKIVEGYDRAESDGDSDPTVLSLAIDQQIDHKCTISWASSLPSFINSNSSSASRPKKLESVPEVRLSVQDRDVDPQIDLPCTISWASSLSSLKNSSASIPSRQRKLVTVLDKRKGYFSSSSLAPGDGVDRFSCRKSPEILCKSVFDTESNRSEGFDEQSAGLSYIPF
jgi:hypothetical protein